ncbi:hypothetical protein ELQ90_10015 [Labedella phragmitis]|uniref:DUF308 domain-containing protein n=1 Tax=Labedella phragmitis TaxID=2498849 RepID=A0A3S4BIT5_9MICO|nr:hypothetical protein [Labedella phragmitis]RWZ51115.1 hypothetical protein ELQ90_10015 [Labedella phragmitis]
MAHPADVDHGAPLGSPSRIAQAYWPVPLVRAVVAAVVALVTTFSLDHSSMLGLLVFGVFVLGAGVLGGVFGAARLGDDAASRRLFLGQAAVSGLAAIAALGFAILAPTPPAYVYLVVAWALLSGLLELVAGVLGRSRTPLARDWSTVGGLTVLLAIVFLAVPPDFTTNYSGAQGVSGTMTTSIMAVGLFGAYTAIVAAYLAIGAFTLRGERHRGAAEGGSRPTGKVTP